MHGYRSHSLLQLAGGPNIEVLKLAFSEYYLNLILLQNYQVQKNHVQICMHVRALTRALLFSPWFS